VHTNLSYTTLHQWPAHGSYIVTATAFNGDYPAGVSASLAVDESDVVAPELIFPTLVNNKFQFQFNAQANARYILYSTTNLAPPVIWKLLNIFSGITNGPMTLSDTLSADHQFYRVLAN